MAKSIFAEMQEAQYDVIGVPAKRQTLNEIVAFFKKDEQWEHYCELIADARKLKKETIMQADMFHIPMEFPIRELPEDFRHDSCGLCKGRHILQAGRAIFPVKDIKGDVAGFCGWDKFDQPKYLDSRGYGYTPKDTMFFGMERLADYYRGNFELNSSLAQYQSDEPWLIVVEGMMCMFALREMGFPAVAKLGSYTSPYIKEVMRRFGKKCIQISDADEAGSKDRFYLQKDIPEMRIIQSKIAKDFDDSRQINMEVYEDLAKMMKSRWYRPKYFK